MKLLAILVIIGVGILATAESAPARGDRRFAFSSLNRYAPRLIIITHIILCAIYLIYCTLHARAPIVDQCFIPPYSYNFPYAAQIVNILCYSELDCRGAEVVVADSICCADRFGLSYEYEFDPQCYNWYVNIFEILIHYIMNVRILCCQVVCACNSYNCASGTAKAMHCSLPNRCSFQCAA